MKLPNLITKIGRTANLFIEKIKGRIQRRRMISLKPNNYAIGNVLISYLNEPFTLKPDDPIFNSHTQYWECRQMAITFLEMGYCVDIIRCDNDVFIPKKQYSFFIETRLNLQRVTSSLNPNCIKIYHADTAHILFHNAAEARRLLELQQRRGITLTARRYEPANYALENADCVFVLGNDFTANTYKYANKPIHHIPISTPVLYPWNPDKNFDNCRHNFLFFSSRGLVHKGLDLVLEAFAEMPEYNLTICAPVNKEEDFYQAYFKELYQTVNIRTLGWVDIRSIEFQQIAESCVGIVNPSCSEGGGGAVITCMHAGMIPIASHESSVDLHDFGMILNNSSIAEIKAKVRQIASLPANQLEEMAHKAWEYARANHTREIFAKAYKNKILEISQQCDKQSLMPKAYRTKGMIKTKSLLVNK
ncbi:glycosyltransferase [Brunnivagina elsteri]|uniref:Glycosyl transferase family 1 n=1 Tax=Brunnivagina elsteri CCALA 953 TaxID=987040 RepID=A0A2A2TIU6_9CYAN|nr:glycosyltransferase [Calothrix elsteri]PAX53975.1 glycosyl transferase family 1 [Calothrix elsteri CCALA 953]